MIHISFVVVLIIRPHKGEYELLMARRSEDLYMGGTWQLISGRIEPNETAWQAALREMDEETKLAPTEFYRLDTLTHFYRADNDSLNTAPMFCAIVEENAMPCINEEHSEYQWVNVNEAESKLMWPSDQQALAEVEAVILKDGLAKEYMRIPL